MKRIFTHDASFNQGDEIGPLCRQLTMVPWNHRFQFIVIQINPLTNQIFPCLTAQPAFLTIQPYIFGCLNPIFLCNIPIFSWVQPGKASIFGWAPAAPC
jgi:hypothetical protein